MPETLGKPFYQKLSFNLMSIALIALALHFGKNLFLPLLFSILLATLLLPFTRFFARHKFPKVFSVLIPVTFAILIGGGILFLLGAKVINFTNDLPVLKERISELEVTAQHWVYSHANISIRKQDRYISETVDNMKDNLPTMAKETFGSISSILMYIALIPIYTFLILFNRSVIKKFIVSSFKVGSSQNVTDILDESMSISQQYVMGLLIETTLVFTLNAAGFLILGIKYAVFLALLGALLNLIPYVGILTANVICMLITLISSDNSADVLWVGAILAAVQFIDNNFGMPLIMGNKVRVNALVIIFSVLLGGSLCGIPGMFLAIPSLAVCKVICDRVTELQPLGELLGDGSTTKLSASEVKKLKKIADEEESEDKS